MIKSVLQGWPVERLSRGPIESLVRWSLALLTFLVVLHSRISTAQEETFDKETYHTAVEYCRGTVPRPMALSSDRLILCYDGWIDKDMDLSPARDLKDHGLFVVRSFGGDIETAIALSDLLRDRAATVVVYDFCVSACANYFVVASGRTYVLEGSLVAWRISIVGPGDCVSFEVPRDLGPKKMQQLSCGHDPFDHPSKLKDVLSVVVRFYQERTIDPLFEPPPDSFYVRRVLKSLYDQTGAVPDVWWTLSPSHCKATFKTKIDYEAYPASQEEVDEMVARLALTRVIYDP